MSARAPCTCSSPVDGRRDSALADVVARSLAVTDDAVTPLGDGRVLPLDALPRELVRDDAQRVVGVRFPTLLHAPAGRELPTQIGVALLLVSVTTRVECGDRGDIAFTHALLVAKHVDWNDWQ